MNILVLGQGFIGTNLVYRLLGEGHQVTVFTKETGSSLHIRGCNYVNGDFSLIEDYPGLFDGIEIVFHLISTTTPKESNDDPAYDIASNAISTVKMLERCWRTGVKKIIFPSSGGTVYGLPRSVPITEDHPTEPICSYGISKLMIEKYLYMFNYLYGLNYQILRISNPYGPYHSSKSQGAIDVFLSRALRGEPIEIWGDGSVTRDYVYIDDVIDALYQSLFDSDTKILNIGSGRGTTLNGLLYIIREITGEEINVVYKKRRQVDIPINVLSIEKAAECYGWKPKVDLYKGIEITWEWLGKIHREMKIRSL